MYILNISSSSWWWMNTQNFGLVLCPKFKLTKTRVFLKKSDPDSKVESWSLFNYFYTNLAYQIQKLFSEKSPINGRTFSYDKDTDIIEH